MTTHRACSTLTGAGPDKPFVPGRGVRNPEYASERNYPGVSRETRSTAVVNGIPSTVLPRFLFGLVGALSMVMAATAGELSPARQRELDNLLKHDCGACHGLRMTGGLGPALTPAALAPKSAALLEQIVRDGRPGTPMPPFEPLLAPEEIRWLVNRLRDGGAGAE